MYCVKTSKDIKQKKNTFSDFDVICFIYIYTHPCVCVRMHICNICWLFLIVILQYILQTKMWAYYIAIKKLINNDNPKFWIELRVFHYSQYKN